MIQSVLKDCWGPCAVYSEFTTPVPELIIGQQLSSAIPICVWIFHMIFLQVMFNFSDKINFKWLSCKGRRNFRLTTFVSLCWESVQLEISFYNTSDHVHRLFLLLLLFFTQVSCNWAMQWKFDFLRFSPIVWRFIPLVLRQITRKSYLPLKCTFV